MVKIIKTKYSNFNSSNKEKISSWWGQIETWRERKKSLAYKKDNNLIMPQQAVERLYELTKTRYFHYN